MQLVETHQSEGQPARRAKISSGHRSSVTLALRYSRERKKENDAPGKNASEKHQEDADDHLAPKFGGTKFLAYRGSHRTRSGVRGEGRGVGWGSSGREKHGSQGPKGDGILNGSRGPRGGYFKWRSSSASQEGAFYI